LTTKNGVPAYQNDSNISQSPIGGLVYVGRPPGGPIFYFDGEVPALQLVDDPTDDETRKTPLDTYHWHEKSLTFHGTVQWDDEEGRRQWDVILQFSSDLRFISNGVVVKHSSDENTRYPLDGLWEVQWESGMRDEIVVSQNVFSYGSYRYVLDLSGDRPTFQWPSHNVVQTVTEGVDLGAQPQGTPVGSHVVWETSENERIIWTRKSDEIVMRFGPGGRMYCRLDATGIRSRPTYCQDSLWGNTFCQGLKLGLASYQFLSAEDGAHISYEHPLCAQWPPLDDGTPVPSQVYFKNISLDETERVFRGTIEWQEEYGTTWQGCSKWIYEMKFDSEYTCILSGVVKSISNGNQEQEMSKFGMDLVYINAAVMDKFRSLMSHDFDHNVARMSHSLRVRLASEGASNRTMVVMVHVLVATQQPESTPIDFNL
jgi:hypothetical protein